MSKQTKGVLLAAGGHRYGESPVPVPSTFFPPRTSQIPGLLLSDYWLLERC